MTIQNLFCKLLIMQIKKYLFIPTILISGFLAAQDLKEKLQADLDPLMEKVIEWRHDIHEFPELGNREFRTSKKVAEHLVSLGVCLLYTSPSPRDISGSRMPSSA